MEMESRHLLIDIVRLLLLFVGSTRNERSWYFDNVTLRTCNRISQSTIRRVIHSVTAVGRFRSWRVARLSLLKPSVFTRDNKGRSATACYLSNGLIMLSGKRDRANDYFRRAMGRLIQRCDQVSRRYNADVYILIRRRCRHYEYKSTEDPSFPPTSRYLVSLAARNLSPSR